MREMQQRHNHSILPLSSSSTGTPTWSSDSQQQQQQPSPIPPWVHFNSSTSAENAQLLAPPEEILPNTRHYKPPPSNYKPGRKWDHLRTAEPAFLSLPVAESQRRWRQFMFAGPNPHDNSTSGGQGEDGMPHVVSRRWMDEHMPGWNPSWRPTDDVVAGGEGQTKGLMYKGMWFLSPERQERTVRAFWRILLKNPFIPLAFRITVLAFSAAALALSASIYVKVQHVNHDSNSQNQCASRASTYMAIIVDTIALPYIAYVTWDEYLSKPLGLRSVAAKILLLLCDLYFIVFSASNLSLAFDALGDRRWACYDEHFYVSGHGRLGPACPNNPEICRRQKALSGVLVVSLLAWLLTFSTSVLRVVEKLRPD